VRSRRQSAEVEPGALGFAIVGRLRPTDFSGRALRERSGDRLRVQACERAGQQRGIVGLALGVQIAGGRLDVGVAHPGLDLDERGAVDGHRAEVVAQGVEGQCAQAGALDCGGVAAAEGAGVEVTTEGAGEYGVVVADNRSRRLRRARAWATSGTIGTLRTLPLFGVTSSPKL